MGNIYEAIVDEADPRGEIDQAIEKIQELEANIRNKDHIINGLKSKNKRKKKKETELESGRRTGIRHAKDEKPVC